MTEQKLPFVILSAETKESKHNSKRTFALRELLSIERYNFKEVKGFYDGNHENSFLVYLDNEPDMGKAIECLKIIALLDFDQNSILFVDRERNATLFFRNGNNVQIGKFQHVQWHEIANLTAWTQDIETGFYYTCK